MNHFEDAKVLRQRVINIASGEFRRLPEFPKIDHPFFNLVNASSYITGSPPEIFIATYLPALAVVAQSLYIIQEPLVAGRKDILSLYCMAIEGSGGGKKAPFKAAIKPIRTHYKSRKSEYNKELALYEREKHQAHAQREAISNSPAYQTTEEKTAAINNIEEPAPPGAIDKLDVRISTTEAFESAFETMKVKSRMLASEEFVTMLDGFSARKSRPSLLGAFCLMWEGESGGRSTKTNKEDTEAFDMRFSLAALIQTQMANNVITEDDTFYSSGFMGRTLLFMSSNEYDDLPYEARIGEYSSPEEQHRVEQCQLEMKYYDVAMRLLLGKYDSLDEIYPEDGDPNLAYSPEASKKIRYDIGPAFFPTNSIRNARYREMKTLHESIESMPLMAGYINRLSQQIARVAAILSIYRRASRNEEPGIIDACDVDAAIEIVLLSFHHHCHYRYALQADDSITQVFLKKIRRAIKSESKRIQQDDDGRHFIQLSRLKEFIGALSPEEIEDLLEDLQDNGFAVRGEGSQRMKQRLFLNLETLIE